MATSAKPRIFVDSNVIASAFFSPSGPPAQILDLHRAGKITVVISQQVIGELTTSVAVKLGARLRQLLFFFLHTPPEIVSDPADENVAAILGTVNLSDAPILAAALAAQADCFVTGDRTLRTEALRLSSQLRILTPREFIGQFEPNS